MSARISRLTITSLLALLGACGGGDGGTNGPPPAPVLTTVEISPNPVTMFMGDTAKLTFTAKDQNGNAMSGKTATWSSDASAVAAVDTSGTVVAKTAGTARITATIEGKVGSVTLTSTGPGTTGAVPGSANIGTAGGSVQATLPGGGSLALTVPSGALRATTTVQLEPLVAAPGALVSFRLSPAGLRLDKKASLVIKPSTGAKLRATSTLVFEEGGRRIPVLSTVNQADGSLTVSLAALGLTDTAAVSGLSAAQASRFGAQAASGSGSVFNLTQDMLYGDVQVAMDQLDAFGTIAYGDHAQTAWEALTGQGIPPVVNDSRFIPFRTRWTTSVCNFTRSAFSALDNFNFVSDYAGLERVILSVVGWNRVSLEMDRFLRGFSQSTCALGLPDPATRMHSKLVVLQSAIIGDLNNFAVEPAPRDSNFFADRLKPLINLASTLALMGMPTDAQLLQDIVRDQLIRLRQVGYARCRATGASQELQARLARNLVVGPLPGLTLNDIQTDIENCGMRIDWAVLDSVGIATVSGTLGGDLVPGAPTTSASATLFGDGEVRLRGGILQALLCPAPSSANNEQLEIVAGRTTQSLRRVAILTPSNQNRYLAVSPLHIPTDTLRGAAGIAPGDTGTVTIVIRRTGSVCSGLLTLTSHSPIATLRLTLEKDAVNYFRNFTTGPAGTEWSTQQLSTSPSGQRFLGELGNTSTTLTIDSLRPHTKLTLEFDLYIIDSWNGNGGQGNAAAPDIIEISVVNGASLKRTTFSNKPSDAQAFPGNYPGTSNPAGTGAFAKTSLGYPPDTDHFGDSSYRLRLTFDHTGSVIRLRFASQQTSGQNERWGIDNVRITRVP